MRILLVSHGETQSIDRAGGSTLSQLGARQALAVADELRETVLRRSAIDKVYAGDAEAALASARIIARGLDLEEPATLSGLIIQDSAAAESDEATIAAMRAIQDDAWSVIEQLRDTHADEAAQVIAVAPALTVHGIVCRALSMPLENYRRLRVDPASITTLAFRQNRTILASLNETCFLEDLEA